MQGLKPVYCTWQIIFMSVTVPRLRDLLGGVEENKPIKLLISANK